MENNNSKEKWIIDTDPGCDDMMAILYMLGRKDIDLQMISLVEGNTSIDNVMINIRKIMKISGKRVPIFKGSQTLLKGIPFAIRSHYIDGLGDIPDLINLNVDDILIEEGNSSLKLIEYIVRFPNQINILTIGPLTNLAIAYQLNPEISHLVKNIYMMGGNYSSLGNKLPASEFNFCYDYLSTNIVVQNFKNIVIMPWEPISKTKITYNDLENIKKKLVENNTKYNELIFFYVEKMLNKICKEKGAMTICDMYCAASIFNRKTVDNCFLGKLKNIYDTETLRGAIMIGNRKLVDNFDKGLENLYQNKDYHLIITTINKEVILEELSNIFVKLL